MELKKGIKRYKNFHGNYLNLGGLYLMRYDKNNSPDYLKKSIEYTKRAIKLYPYDPSAYNHLALARICQGQFTKAAMSIKMAMYVLEKTDFYEASRSKTDGVLSLFKQKAPDFDFDSVVIPYDIKRSVGME